MSLFKCSTPERRRADQVLPVIPNEIYLHIFDLIAPYKGRLQPEDLETLHNISLVCKFFANICLPRVFELVEFLCSYPRDHAPVHKTSLGSTLCTRIAEKQPLALALAQTVRACFFTGWRSKDTGSSTVDPFANKCLTATLQMKNIRQFNMSNCIVDAELWSVITALPLLEDSVFFACDFLQGQLEAADAIKPEKNIKLKVSRLSILECFEHQQFVAAVDMAYLRTFAIDFRILERNEWPGLRQSVVTELQVHAFDDNFPEEEVDYKPWINILLKQVPQSLEALCFVPDGTAACTMAHDLLQSLLDDPGWKDLASLRSLTLRVDYGGVPDSYEIFETIDNNLPTLRRILHDKLYPVSGLRCVDFLGRVFRFVSGEWSESEGDLYERNALATDA